MDMITLVFGIPLAAIIAATLGRWAQRKMWSLDLPYNERVKLLRICRSGAAS